MNRYAFLCIPILLISVTALSQDRKTDLLFLAKAMPHGTAAHHITQVDLSGKSFLVHYNPFVLSLAVMMYVYQRHLSHQISADCLYEPSCSNFSKLAIQRFGIVKGIFLSADRLTRCNHLSAKDAWPVHYTESGKIQDYPGKYVIKK